MILFVIFSLGRGGAERVIVHLANYWAGQGRQVGILTFDTSPPQYVLHPAVQLIQNNIAYPSSNRLTGLVNNFKRLLILRGRIKSLRPSTVISFTEDVNSLVCLATIGRRFRLILSDRIHPDWFGKRPIRQWLKRVSYPLADVLVVQTHRVKEAYKGFKIPIAVINNPLPSVSQRVINYDKKCIISAGRLDSQKNFPLLIEAVSRLQAPDWSVHIFGEGSEKSALQDLIIEKHLENRVLLRGSTPHILDEMVESSIFVLPSLAEGYPNVLIEAMSVGLAVVSTDCPSGPDEIIYNNKNGLLVENNNAFEMTAALQRLVDDAQLRQQLGEQGLKIKEKLKMDVIAQAWEQFL